MSTVLVTDAGRGSAVAFIRSLARAGHRVVAGDDRRISAGRWSRASFTSFRYPDPYRDLDGVADGILEQVVRHDVDVLLPITDVTLQAVRSLDGRLPSTCIVGAPPRDAAAVAADKGRTVELAQQLGVPVPGTVLAATVDEAVAAGTTLGWPVVVKPVSTIVTDADGALGKLVVGYAADETDMADKFERLGEGSPVLVQELCEGDGVGVEVLAHDGRVLRAFSHRRIHEVPPSGGASALRASVALDGELLDMSERLIDALGWTGLAMVEFKSGRSGPRLMEINGRPWGSLPLAVAAGVDFPADYVRLLTAGPGALGAASADYEVGTIARNLQLEVVWIGTVLSGGAAATATHRPPSRRAALAAIARLFSPRVRDDVLSLRDPAASIAELLAVGAKLLGKARSR